MIAEDADDAAASKIAAAIGEPARARILYCLMDGHARTSTELAIVADVSPSTGSAHLHKLKAARLIKVLVQGKHRYYSLHGPPVARVLESLSVLAGGVRSTFVPSTPNRLRAARTCYDHMAGSVAVSLHDRLMELGWLTIPSKGESTAYDVTSKGTKALEMLGIDVEGARALRRRFAYACLDWSERRPHVAGAIGAALLKLALMKQWVEQDLDSRTLSVTRLGERELQKRFGLRP
ncbi:MAG TPA: helix-turn-helix domain-containing protein [Candidatus Baltobacteraceae bacterium]|jgi:DNA-binding transcriptional ArsR family regulator|nr:helix-turn-helix domain-containing protein [Candidatus Baltobacteraceae bacterium]